MVWPVLGYLCGLVAIVQVDGPVAVRVLAVVSITAILIFWGAVRRPPS